MILLSLPLRRLHCPERNRCLKIHCFQGFVTSFAVACPPQNKILDSTQKMGLELETRTPTGLLPTAFKQVGSDIT